MNSKNPSTPDSERYLAVKDHQTRSRRCRCTSLFRAGLPTKGILFFPRPSGPRQIVWSGAWLGGADRDRTDDLRLAKPALSQLSYSPVGVISCLAIPTLSPPPPSPSQRFSPKTPRSDKRWWAWEDLNLRPPAYQADALTN